MTSPDNPAETLRKIVKYHHIPILILVRDSRQIDPQGRGISHTKFYEMIEYAFAPKPGGRVEDVLKRIIAELKQKYPIDEITKDDVKVSSRRLSDEVRKIK